MTKPDRLSSASAIAQTSAFSAAAHPNAKPVAHAEHDRMANAIRALAMDAVEQAKSQGLGRDYRISRNFRRYERLWRQRTLL